MGIWDLKSPSEHGRYFKGEGSKQMRTIVIYNSQTGFTKQYAQWIAGAAGADILELAAAKKKDLTTYGGDHFWELGMCGRHQ